MECVKILAQGVTEFLLMRSLFFPFLGTVYVSGLGTHVSGAETHVSGAET